MAKEAQPNTQIRIKEFDVELAKLQEKFDVRIYAVLQTYENGEVYPIIKIADNLKLDVENKTYEEQNKSKSGHFSNKKA